MAYLRSRMPLPSRLRSVAFALLCATGMVTSAAAQDANGPQSVALTGILGNKALLVVNAGAPKAVEAGSISRVRYDNYRELYDELKNFRRYR